MNYWNKGRGEAFTQRHSNGRGKEVIFHRSHRFDKSVLRQHNSRHNITVILHHNNGRKQRLCQLKPRGYGKAAGYMLLPLFCAS